MAGRPVMTRCTRMHAVAACGPALTRCTRMHEVAACGPALTRCACMQWPDLFPDMWRQAPHNPLITLPECTVVVGKPRDWPTYGWDNEYGRREMLVGAFEASEYQITNHEFLEFVKAGGYRDEHLWTPDGWRWCEHTRICMQIGGGVDRAADEPNAHVQADVPKCQVAAVLGAVRAAGPP
jgi:formylglycine-generating enzyme required for sulfatase activity